MSELQRPSPSLDRFRSATFVFLAIALVKVIFFFRTVGAAVRATNSGPVQSGFPAFAVHHTREIILVGAVLYFLSAVLALLISSGISRRLDGAVKVGRIYALVQIAGILFFRQLGYVAVINLVLGVMALLNLQLARELGDRDAGATPPRSPEPD